MAIFTFLLFFLYPRYLSGEINGVLFQLTIVVIVSVIFSLVVSATYYYSDTLTMSVPPERLAKILSRADGFWLIGYSLLLLEPALILFTINLLVVGIYAIILWLIYCYVTWLAYKKLTKRK